MKTLLHVLLTAAVCLLLAAAFGAWHEHRYGAQAKTHGDSPLLQDPLPVQGDPGVPVTTADPTAKAIRLEARQARYRLAREWGQELHRAYQQQRAFPDTLPAALAAQAPPDTVIRYRGGAVRQSLPTEALAMLETNTAVSSEDQVIGIFADGHVEVIRERERAAAMRAAFK